MLKHQTVLFAENYPAIRPSGAQIHREHTVLHGHIHFLVVSCICIFGFRTKLPATLSPPPSLRLTVCRSRRWTPSAPVPWVHLCWRGRAPSLQPRPLSSAQRLAPRAWNWSGARMRATHTRAAWSLTTWSTHYRWRTRTTGMVRCTASPLTSSFTPHCRVNREMAALWFIHIRERKRTTAAEQPTSASLWFAVYSSAPSKLANLRKLIF